MFVVSCLWYATSVESIVQSLSRQSIIVTIVISVFTYAFTHTDFGRICGCRGQSVTNEMTSSRFMQQRQLWLDRQLYIRTQHSACERVDVCLMLPSEFSTFSDTAEFKGELSVD